MPVQGRWSEARERLLATASKLFYTEGIRAVGVDRVMAEADVARGTFYRHFDGKDDLVRAYLDARHQRIGAGLAAAKEAAASPVAFLETVARGIGEEMCSEGFRGCPFINAAAEYPERKSAVHQAVLAYRDHFHEVLQETFQQVGVPDPKRSTDAMVALRDGVMVAAYLGDPQTASDTLVHGVAVLLADR
ncbi:TetR/AcrR family transcriptional regulator [Streptomyces chartreusis]|uniref:TetR/AcrR family transcriptional regulator n=1 Tax=Streptomyces chartreusis TaxID=1969 RepID=A0A7H8T1A9_STRCX|nr:TetR/AcrR family transcriptional regulator [Streptomyces chartreusis]QKZ17289.1 TetR/AcrR family transcriptional regulator [Streptomyces chartreusis]